MASFTCAMIQPRSVGLAVRPPPDEQYICWQATNTVHIVPSCKQPQRGPAADFLFIGAPLYSYTVAVVVGEFTAYESSVGHPQLRYCVFTIGPNNSRFHPIALHSPEYTQAFIDAWGGGSEGGPLPCPE